MSGRSVARSYWGRSAETEECFNAYIAGTAEGPFMRTGDLGFIRDGEIFVTGRLKDLIIIRGRNIYPQDIERTVENVVGFVRPNTCAAFSIEENGEEALAIVIEADRALVRLVQRRNREQSALDDNGDSHGENRHQQEIEGLVARIRQAVAQEYEIQLRRVTFVMPGTFPRTTSGKVQRSVCRARMLKEELEEVYSTSSTVQPRLSPISHPGQMKAAPDDLKVFIRARLNSVTHGAEAESRSHRFRYPANIAGH